MIISSSQTSFNIFNQTRIRSISLLYSFPLSPLFQKRRESLNPEKIRKDLQLQFSYTCIRKLSSLFVLEKNMRQDWKMSVWCLENGSLAWLFQAVALLFVSADISWVICYWSHCVLRKTLDPPICAFFEDCWELQ